MSIFDISISSAALIEADGWGFYAEARVHVEAAVADTALLSQELPSKVDRQLRKWSTCPKRKLAQRFVD